MYRLTVEQKISNYRDLVAQKKTKVENLQKEIQNLEIKISKLEKTSSENPTKDLTAAIRTMKSDLI